MYIKHTQYWPVSVSKVNITSTYHCLCMWLRLIHRQQWAYNARLVLSLLPPSLSSSLLLPLSFVYLHYQHSPSLSYPFSSPLCSTPWNHPPSVFQEKPSVRNALNHPACSLFNHANPATITGWSKFEFQVANYCGENVELPKTKHNFDQSRTQLADQQSGFTLRLSDHLHVGHHGCMLYLYMINLITWHSNFKPNIPMSVFGSWQLSALNVINMCLEQLDSCQAHIYYQYNMPL